ncbi:hypothetical protein R1sor_013916 [Riccia sorocarpa]|uniref:Diacylglycerol O-acyltransferase n=1 Tax=Riccia sorocarpa TaxID=122646 RepID=A0ABD3HAJ5_9MARC
MGSEGEVLVSPYQEFEGSLRLRPVNTGRSQAVPSTSYLEETWKDEPMTPAGRVFLDPLFDLVCVVILGFKEPINTDSFRDYVEMTIMKHKRFSSRIETRKGEPWWTQVKTDVKEHVLEMRLTPEQKADEDFVLNYTTDVLIHKPFDAAKPLWDIHLVDAKLGEAEACAVVRIHHALGDGTSLISLLMACSRMVGKPDVLPSFPTSSVSKVPAEEMTSKVYTAFLLSLWRLLVFTWYSLTEIGKFIATLIWVKDSETPIKGSQGCERLPKTYRFLNVELEDLRSVSKAVGGTMNDVFMAMAARGLKRYMEYRVKKDAEDEEKKAYGNGHLEAKEIEKTSEDGSKAEQTSGAARKQKSDSKLEKARVRGLAMINTRPTPGLPELADMMAGAASQARWGNHMGYLLFELPMKQPEDPLDLLREVKMIGDRKKSSLEGPFTYASGALTMKLCGTRIASDLVYRSCVHTTLSISNVKGPAQEVMFADNPITHIIPSVVGQPHALTLHLQSYNGRGSLVTMSTKDVIPDPEYLLELCVEALEDMKEAVAQRKV